MQLDTREVAILESFERPVLVIALVARMLVGLGLAAAVFVQLYMLILTDLRCEDGSAHLGNLIRCTDPMDLISGAVVLLAAIGLVAAIFAPKRLNLVETGSMLLLAVVVRFLADIQVASATWEVALVLTALFASLGSLIALRLFAPSRNDLDPQPDRRGDAS